MTAMACRASQYAESTNTRTRKTFGIVVMRGVALEKIERAFLGRLISSHCAIGVVKRTSNGAVCTLKPAAEGGSQTKLFVTISASVPARLLSNESFSSIAPAAAAEGTVINRSSRAHSRSMADPGASPRSRRRWTRIERRGARTRGNFNSRAMGAANTAVARSEPYRTIESDSVLFASFREHCRDAARLGDWS